MGVWPGKSLCQATTIIGNDRLAEREREREREPLLLPTTFPNLLPPYPPPPAHTTWSKRRALATMPLLSFCDFFHINCPFLRFQTKAR